MDVCEHVNIISVEIEGYPQNFCNDCQTIIKYETELKGINNNSMDIFDGDKRNELHFGPVQKSGDPCSGHPNNFCQERKYFIFILKDILFILNIQINDLIFYKTMETYITYYSFCMNRICRKAIIFNCLFFDAGDYLILPKIEYICKCLNMSKRYFIKGLQKFNHFCICRNIQSLSLNYRNFHKSEVLLNIDKILNKKYDSNFLEKAENLFSALDKCQMLLVPSHYEMAYSIIKYLKDVEIYTSTKKSIPFNDRNYLLFNSGLVYINSIIIYVLYISSNGTIPNHSNLSTMDDVENAISIINNTSYEILQKAFLRIRQDYIDEFLLIDNKITAPTKKNLKSSI